MKAFFLYLCFFLLALGHIKAEEVAPDVTVMIPMRDGVELPADLYLPSPEARNLPCILLRSPAGRRNPHWLHFANMAKEGYVIAIQDTRSAIDQEGKTLPFVGDGWGKLQDGYDTVEWLAKSPYTNGKIGTWGSSALGITQLLMAATQPPHLLSQYIIVAAASLYHHALFPGGILLKNQAEGWLGHYARDSGVLCYVSQRPFYNQFWKQLNSLEMSHRVNVPGIHVGGWYDTFLQGTLASFSARQHRGDVGGRLCQKLVIGPWTHLWPLSKHFGDFEVPQEGINSPIDISPKRWFEYYLKGIDNGLTKIPSVIYYVMGPFDHSPSRGNVWRTADQWPVPAKQTSYYLTPTFHLKKEPSESTNISYRYDPNQPIPTSGGRNLFLESGPKDQRNIEKRSDILVFTTDCFTEDVEVTGPLSATLFVSSDQIDTDFMLRLCDVYPDGRSILISEGGCRLGLDCYSDKKRKYNPNEIIELNVDLWATSIVFAKGHAIRLSISSSNYPRYEKNMNIGVFENNTGKFQIAKNNLYMGKKFPSRLILPIVEHESSK